MKASLDSKVMSDLDIFNGTVARVSTLFFERRMDTAEIAKFLGLKESTVYRAFVVAKQMRTRRWRI